MRLAIPLENMSVTDKVESNTARVCAVLDCRRNPDWISDRLS
jgi:hypothetical protein